MKGTRREKDSIGELDVPEDAYYGINTQRARMNFQISGQEMPSDFIVALAEVKKACALANLSVGALDKKLADPLIQAADEIIIENKFLDQFPIDIFQTGSGTQTNVNMNEVLSNRANELLGHPRGTKFPVHPNDHANMSQSSNDIIPTAMHVSAIKAIRLTLVPSIDALISTLKNKIREFSGIVKTGRTHLQDAVPIPLSMEFQVYLSQVESSQDDFRIIIDELAILPVGGSALGTGINVPDGFSDSVAAELRKMIGVVFHVNAIKAEGISSHRTIVRASSMLRSLALSVMKMANDIRLMGSGPRSGLGELILPQNEPGSSIMAGKVNPTQAEALVEVCLQVLGNDTVISLAESHGSILDLNVTKPLMIVRLLESIRILAAGIRSFTDHCLVGTRANLQRIDSDLERSLMLATRLVPIIGYDRTAEVAKKASESGLTIKEVIAELGIVIDGNLDEILDPKRMV